MVCFCRFPGRVFLLVRWDVGQYVLPLVSDKEILPGTLGADPVAEPGVNRGRSGGGGERSEQPAQWGQETAVT
jgi:hypothetical protein